MTVSVNRTMQRLRYPLRASATKTSGFGRIRTTSAALPETDRKPAPRVASRISKPVPLLSRLHNRTITQALAAALLLITAPGIQAQSTEQRLDRIERLLESSTLLEMFDQNEQLRREVQRLTGELDRVQRELEDLQRQQRSLYEDVDTRLQALERRGDTPSPDNPDSPSADDEPTTLVPETPALDADVDAGTGTAPVDGGRDAEEDYRTAFELLREGAYSAAGDAFQKVLDEHPGTRQANNARYWLGESYYVVRDFDAAMEHFQAVLDDPDHGKFPDALLKAGYIQYERGDFSEARETLQRVLDEFPNSTVATLAENRLSRMDDEGR